MGEGPIVSGDDPREADLVLEFLLGELLVEGLLVLANGLSNLVQQVDVPWILL